MINLCKEMVRWIKEGLKGLAHKKTIQRYWMGSLCLVTFTAFVLSWNARRAYADTVFLSYDGVDYLTEDLQMTWDVSETKGAGKILAYYFRDLSDPEKYGGGTVVIKDVDPSLNPDNPNRLMTFTNAAVYDGDRFVHYYSNSWISISEFWNDFENYRYSNYYITTPWSNMSEYSKKNGTDNIVHRIVVANEVHTGCNLNGLFGGLSECKYFDVRNLKVDYEYIKANCDDERANKMFYVADDCVIKMFDNSSYLPYAFEDPFYGIEAYNITLDYSDVDMDFSDAFNLTYSDSSIRGGSAIEKIILPKTLKNASSKIPLYDMLFEYEEGGEGYFFSVHKANGDVIGYTDHMIAQDDAYDEFDGTPSYIEKEDELLPYYVYNLYNNPGATSNDKINAMAIFNTYLYYYSQAMDNTNMGIDLESFCNKTNHDSFIYDAYAYLNAYAFCDTLFSYMKEKLEEKFGEGNYMLPLDIAADFSYNKQNDTNNNPYHIAYLAMNEFFKSVFGFEIETSNQKETYTYLDEIEVKIKNTSNSILKNGFNFIFGNLESKEIHYYDEFEHDGNVYDETTIGGVEQNSIVPAISYSDDYYRLTYTIDVNSDDSDGSYFCNYIFPENDATVHVKISLNKTVRDDLLLKFRNDGWYGSRSPLYISGVMFNDNVYEFDITCEEEDGYNCAVFDLDEHNLESGEVLTIEITLPRNCLELVDKEFETVPDVASIMSVCRESSSLTYCNELTNYYVVKVKKEQVWDHDPVVQYDGTIDHGYFYYSDGEVSAYQTLAAMNPEWYPAPGVPSNISDPDTITDSNVEDLIASDAFLMADTNLCDAAIIFDADDYDNTIFIFPKKLNYNKIKDGNEFKMNFTNVGSYSSSAFFKGFKENYKPGRLYSTYVVNPLSLSDSSISIVTNDGSDHNGAFGLHVNTTDGATYNSIKLYRTNNANKKVEIPIEDYEINYSSNKGNAGSKGALTITPKNVNLTGSKTYEFNLYEKDDNHNGIDDNFETKPSGGGGGGGGGSSSPKIEQPEVKVEVTFDEFLPFINGYDDGEFKPNKPMTRAEFAKIIATISDNFENDSSKYSSLVSKYKDVRDNYWNTPYIGYVISENIMNGYPDGTFCPDANITRAEVCTVLSRLFNPQDKGVSNKFEEEIKDEWYTESVTKMITAGLINGYDDGTFGANRNITRAELVALVNRVMNKNYDEEKLKELEDKIESMFKDVKKTDWFCKDVVKASASEDKASLTDIIIAPIKVAEGLIKNLFD